MAERKAQHPSNIRRIVPASWSEEGEDETGGDVGALARADSSGSSTSSGGVVLARASSRRERQLLRRVQPLGEDESEEARVRGVPVPAVHLPDDSPKVRRPETQAFPCGRFLLFLLEQKPCFARPYDRACVHALLHAC